MQVTMADLNKNANSIINQAHSSGEPVIVLKHGKPIARILPIQDRLPVDDALKYLVTLKPVDVRETIESVISKGRQRGL